MEAILLHRYHQASKGVAKAITLMSNPRPVKIQVMSSRSTRKHAGVYLSCGLRICPGSNEKARKCLALRFTEEEWRAIKEVKAWV